MEEKTGLEKLMDKRANLGKDNAEQNPSIIEPVTTATPTESKPLQTDFDFSEFEVSNIDELKTRYNELKTSSTTYQEQLSEREQLLAAKALREQELEQSVNSYKEQLEKANLYQDEDAHRWAIVKKENPEMAKVYARLMSGDTLDPKEIVRMNLKKEYPEEDAEGINFILEEKYRLNLEKPDENDDDAVERYNRQKRLAEADLKRDARVIQESLLTEFRKIEVPKLQTKSVEQIMIEKAQAKESWGSYLDKVSEVSTKIQSQIKVGEETVTIDIPIPPEQQKVLSKNLTDYVYTNGIKYDEKVVDGLVQLAKSQVLMANQERRDQAIWDAATKYYDKKLKELQGGNSMPSITQAKPVGNEAYQEMLRDLKNRRGV